MEEIRATLKELDLTEKQKRRLEDFLQEKIKLGDLTAEDLAVQGELGSGNGGVVLKVTHKKTFLAMAKKVSGECESGFLQIVIRLFIGFILVNSFGSEAGNKKSDYTRAQSIGRVQFALHCWLLWSV